MSFTPKTPNQDIDIKGVVEHITDLEKRILDGFDTAQFNSINLNELHTTPQKPRNGDIINADGTDYNPGSGQGIYHFNGTVYTKL